MQLKIFAAALAASLFTAQAQAWGDHEQGALAGIAAVLIYQKVTEPKPRPAERIIVQQHPVYRPHPSYNGNPVQYIPQRDMPIPTGFQEPCQFPGHHARIYDRYGQVVAIRVCE
jgi:hypothetical protein